MGRFGRSVQLASSSTSVLRHHRQLLLLPVASLVASWLVVAAIATPLLTEGYRTTGQLAIIGGIAMLVVGGVQAYFYAALTAGAVDHFEGRTPTVASATNAATGLLPVLVGWAAISWLVSALAALVRDRVPIVGPFIAGLGQVIWGVVTYLSMPVMVIERRGPVQAIRRSGELLKTTWGENLFAQIGFGIYALVLLIPVCAIAGIGAAVHLWIGLGIGLLGITAVCSYISALDAVYRVALYRHATADGTPGEFALVGFDTAFKAKKHRWF